MTPSLAAYQDATPKCPGVPTNTGKYGAGYIRCGKPMTWVDNKRWTCPDHGAKT